MCEKYLHDSYVLPMPRMIPAVSRFSQYSRSVNRLLAVPTRLIFCKPNLRSSYSTLPRTRRSSPSTPRSLGSPSSLSSLYFYTAGPMRPVLRLIPPWYLAHQVLFSSYMKKKPYHSITISLWEVKMHSSAPTPSSPILHDIFPLHLHLLPLPLSSIMRLPHPLLVSVALRSMGGYRYIKNIKARVKKWNFPVCNFKSFD